MEALQRKIWMAILQIKYLPILWKINSDIFHINKLSYTAWENRLQQPNNNIPTL